LKENLSNLNMIHAIPMLLYHDNEVVLHISKNIVFYDKIKHIKVYVILFVMSLFSGMFIPILFSPMSNL